LLPIPINLRFFNLFLSPVSTTVNQHHLDDPLPMDEFEYIAVFASESLPFEQFANPIISIPQDTAEVLAPINAVEAPLGIYANEIAETVTTQRNLQVTISALSVKVIGYIWLVGVALFLLIHGVAYWYFYRHLKTAHREHIPELIRKILEQQGNDMGIIDLPMLIITSAIDAPALIGLFRPRILLPHANYNPEELAFIFRHELIHYKQRDMLHKCILLVANALHWFNPMVYLMAIQAAKDIELACDDAVAHELGETERKQYVNTLLATMPTVNKRRMISMAEFGNGKREMKDRMRNLFDRRSKRQGLIALSLVAICAFLVTSIMRTGYEYIPADEVTMWHFDFVTALPSSQANWVEFERTEFVGPARGFEPGPGWNIGSISIGAYDMSHFNFTSSSIAHTTSENIPATITGDFHFYIPFITAGDLVLVGQLEGIPADTRVELSAEAMEGDRIFMGLTYTPYLRHSGALGNWAIFSGEDGGSVSTRGFIRSAFSDHVYLYVGAGTDLHSITGSFTILSQNDNHSNNVNINPQSNVNNQNTTNNQATNINIYALAPFLTRDAVGEIVLELINQGIDVNINKLMPFMPRDITGEIVLTMVNNGERIDISQIAPFIPRDVMGEIVLIMVSSGEHIDINQVAPFIPRDIVGEIVLTMIHNGEHIDINQIAPFVSRDALGEIVLILFRAGVEIDFNSIAPFMPRDVLSEIVLLSFHGEA